MSDLSETLKEVRNTHCKNEGMCEDCELNILSTKLVDSKYRNKISLCGALKRMINELEENKIIYSMLI